MRDAERAAAFRAVLVLGAALSAGGCFPPDAPPADLDDALGRFRRAFEEGNASHLDGLYPSGWALVSFSGESRRSRTGAGLERRLARLFRDRAPVAYEERPRSILRSEDGGQVLFVPEWTSMEIGTDRLVVERFRIGLERTATTDGPRRGTPGWQIREFTAWAR